MYQKKSLAKSKIANHIERYVGPIIDVIAEQKPLVQDIEILCAKSSLDKGWKALITSGMSNQPMRVPNESELPMFAELMVCIPSDWKLDEKSLTQKEWYWPIELLFYLSRYPSVNKTFFAYGQTIQNGTPPKPYNQNTELCASLFLLPTLVQNEFWIMEVANDKAIVFYCVLPIYKQELELKMQSGLDELINRMDAFSISDVIDPKRKNVGLM